MSNKKELTVDELKDLFANIVEEKLKEFGAKETETKGVVFETPSISAEEIEKMSPQEKLVTFLKEGVFNRNFEVVKALGGGTGADGGYLIPTEFIKEIVMDLPKLSPIRAMATIYNVNSRKGEVPNLAGRPNATWVGENTAITEANPTFGQITFELNKLAILSAMSREMEIDSGIDLTQLIRQLFTEQMAQAENEAFTNGDGTGKPTGFRQATVTTVATTFGYDAVVDLRYAIGEQYEKQGNLVFMTSRKGVSALRKIKGSDGHPIFDPISKTILGIPVIENSDIPANLGAGTDETELWLGNFRYYAIFDGNEYAVRTTEEGGNAFVYDQILMKVTNRLDGKVVLPDGFAKLTGVK